MPFTFRPMDEASAGAILCWRYDPPYDVYNLDPDPEGSELGLLLDPANHYYAVDGEGGDLEAYCCFGLDARVPGGDYDAAALDIGLGVRPDLTGQGQGPVYARAVSEFARSTFKPVAFRVTVARFNRRARRVWEKAGFRPGQAFEREPDGLRFVVLTRDA
jgi:ribosomal-protein-alanine N-acetyltransferase